jgi:small subunit ribosomal protein S6
MVVCNEGKTGAPRPLVLSVRRVCLRASPEKENKEFERMNGADTREYELVYVLQPGLDDTAVQGFEKRIADLIAAQGGTDIVTEPWGRRNLAYSINRYFEGFYILHRFAMPPSGAAELDRTLRFNEDVIRYLLMRQDEY